MGLLKKCNCFATNEDDVLLTELPRRYGQNQTHRPNDKRPKRKIDKSVIGKPSNFQHTGHIGIGEIRNGIVDRVDPEKIKKQMAEIAAVLNFEDTTNQETELNRSKKISENKNASNEDQIIGTEKNLPPSRDNFLV